MSEKDIIRGLLLATNSFSLVGAIFIITAYISLKSIRSFSFQLVFFMAISDFFHSICLMLPAKGIYCQIQGPFMEFTSLSSILWSSCIAYSLYNAVILEKPIGEKLLLKYLMLSYGLPLILTIIPAVFRTYNLSGAWCWINSDYIITVVLRLSCFYVILWIATIFNITVYTKVILKIHKDFKNIIEYHKHNRALIRKLSMYPIILVITYAPISTIRIAQILKDFEVPFWLTCMATIGVSITGFANALVYGLTGPVTNALLNLCRGEDERVQSSFSLYTVQFSESFHTNNL